jgi:dienelactone hydrolase
VFQYSSTSAQSEDEAVADAANVASAAAGSSGRRFALVGASLGGRVVIEVAAKRPGGLAAIVSLSGESTVEDYRDILPEARKVIAPALYIGARSDSLTDGTRQQVALHAAMRGRPNELVQVDGYDHGMQLLHDQLSDGRDIEGIVIAFLDARHASNPAAG